MIIRSLRNIAKGYKNQQDIFFAKQEESSNIIIETNGYGQIQLENPDIKLVLFAKIIPSPINIQSYLEYVSASKKLWKIQLNNNNIHPSSYIKNLKHCVSNIKIQFENTGYLFVNNEKKLFIGKQCDEYKINIKDNILYNKDFITTSNDIQELVSNDGIIIKNAIATRKIYPLGGFYEYGIHPKQIESAVFFVPDLSLPYIKIIPVSEIKNFDPSKNTLIKSNKYFIGIPQLAHQQSLYDDITNGKCSISINYQNHTEKLVSNALIFQEKTNLIKIIFTKKKDNL